MIIFLFSLIQNHLCPLENWDICKNKPNEINQFTYNIFIFFNSQDLKILYYDIVMHLQSTNYDGFT